jgi:hypothetical protein
MAELQVSVRSGERAGEEWIRVVVEKDFQHLAGLPARGDQPADDTETDRYLREFG